MTKVAKAANVVEETEFKWIPWDQIKPFEGQPRTYINPLSVEELADSISAEGQTTPILVVRRPDEEYYTIKGGERRWRACGVLTERTGKTQLMKVVIEPYEGEDKLFSDAFLDNLHRVDMPPLDIASGFERLRQQGRSVEEISKLYGQSTAYVYNYLSLNELDERVKALMHPSLAKDKRLGTTQAIEVAKITNAELQFQIADEAVVSRMTVRDMQLSAVQQADEMGISLKLNIKKLNVSPSKEYNVLSRFLKNSENWLDRELQRMDFEAMYSNHGEAEDVVLADTESINRILQKIRKLKLAIGKAL